ncbi:MAG: hypothetical protein Q8P41_21740 [Pseudomonadota bacterium]|nr:hypothetical protein [Pseudomonadota bacterium]
MQIVSQMRVLLLDPVKMRRDRAENGLRLRFEVEGVGTLAEALVAGVARPPHAIVATLRQVDDNGLVAGRALRQKLGAGIYILVHGCADARKTATDRQTLADRHGVDTWSETALEPEGMEAVVWGELDRRYRPRASAAERKSLLARARSLTANDVKAFLTKDRPLIATPPRAPDEEPGWIELLNAPPTAENLKRLLSKEIGGKRKAQGG